jgi:hypothetical protein
MLRSWERLRFISATLALLASLKDRCRVPATVPMVLDAPSTLAVRPSAPFSTNRAAHANAAGTISAAPTTPNPMPATKSQRLPSCVSFPFSGEPPHLHSNRLPVYLGSAQTGRRRSDLAAFHDAGKLLRRLTFDNRVLSQQNAFLLWRRCRFCDAQPQIGVMTIAVVFLVEEMDCGEAKRSDEQLQ